MRRGVQGLLLVVVATVVIGVVGSGRYLALVRPAMRWPLVASALVLLAAGLLLLLRDRRGPGGAEKAQHDGPGHRVPLVGALLVVPFLGMAVLPVTPLSSWSATRTDGVELAPDATYAPLPGGGVVDLPVSEFVERASFDQKASLTGRTVRLTGFVVPTAQGWRLARMVMVCCAADAYPVTVVVDGRAPAARDAWVRVTGRWVPAPVRTDGRAPAAPRLVVQRVERVPPPADPYE